MPEGDTLFRAATVLRRALLNKTVTRFDSSVELVAGVAARQPIPGRTIHAVEARGKHLLIVFRDPQDMGSEPLPVPEALKLDLLRSDLVLHTHLRMTGSWHIYRPGEAWRKPAHYAKVVVATEDFVAPCFSAPVVELLSGRETARHPQLAALGPDAMTEAFDPSEARARLRRHADVPLGVALMNQRAMAGVGNVYKSEVMFLQRLSPFAPLKDLPDEQLDAVIAVSHKLMRANETNGARRTRFGLDQSQRLWVYGRSGEPCRQCGTTILMRRQGLDGRSTYYCPQCQNVAPFSGNTGAASAIEDNEETHQR
ncbi:putative endonuclease 8 2 [Capsulimonas corticalis]|uniref:DNA-(apurinic or apyrimidinic site) lyase n=1 Tax=Capsulimonas corticalis TaxID=2219043 RepID=A0A402D5H2_9BACT|nr:DNA-formamidopyrimidine glycosylase family protein [Capsulimonas corticalis]BDI29786.1 putative endonuclease 8 2 [Capsulimonas corticalis]